MVRTYKNIKNINANFNASTVEAAVKLVVEKNTSIREQQQYQNVRLLQTKFFKPHRSVFQLA